MRSWADIVSRELSAGEPLADAADALINAQRQEWPLLATGLDALANMKTREYRSGGARVVLQSNPGRRASVHAKTDAAAIAARPCFLCPQNIPAEERGIAYGDLVVLANPFPVVHAHLSVPSRVHQPQRLAGRVEQMLKLAAALGQGRFVLYNGPRCGASAPDHFHFQAGSVSGIPLFDEVVAEQQVSVLDAFGRAGICIRAADALRIAALTDGLLQRLARAQGDDEPMVNVVARWHHDAFTVFVFPRAQHRPDCFSASEPHRVAISPASLEMMGLMVVADIEHFDRVSVELIEGIYKQVCVGADRIANIVSEMT